jgi:hypothetical protein
MHKPTFYSMFDRIYDTPPEQFTNEEHSFLPLLYLALAVGCLFRGVGDSTLEKSGYEAALNQGYVRLSHFLVKSRTHLSNGGIGFNISKLAGNSSISRNVEI